MMLLYDAAIGRLVCFCLPFEDFSDAVLWQRQSLVVSHPAGTAVVFQTNRPGLQQGLIWVAHYHPVACIIIQ